MLHLGVSLLFVTGLLMALAVIWHMIASRLDVILGALDPMGRTAQAVPAAVQLSTRDAMRASARAALMRSAPRQRAAA